MRFLRGKWLAIASYLGIVVLVTAGLAWVTWQALQLERADLIQLALWRLDSRVFPALAREDSRPVAHYEPLYPPVPAITNQAQPIPIGNVLVPSPLLTAEVPEWVGLHFVVDNTFGWRSPVVLDAKLQQRLTSPPVSLDLVNATPRRAQQLEELNRQYPVEAMLARFGIAGESPAHQQQVEAIAPQQLQQRGQVFSPENDFVNRSRQQSAVRNEGKGYEGSNSLMLNLPVPGKAALWSELPGSGPTYACVPTNVDAMLPHWLKGADDVERLMLLRSIKTSSLNALQGVVIEWAKLREVLLNEIRDLLPDAYLENAPANGGSDCMTALPVRLVTGPSSMSIFPLSTPMRKGLLLAWSAAGLGLLVTAMCGWSLYDLSERRFRFVTAVTHELRTPLTSMRLFLDMLTGGMVREEKKKEEYLKILDQESDRLNRLISNVLDFARLERQRPMIQMKSIPPADLLQAIQTDWQERCRSAGKELVVETGKDLPTLLVTDPDLCRQLLGNLVENACKYARGSTDERIWLRAVNGNGHIIFEVEDRGPGVARNEARGLFRPFCRGEKASETAGGIGLGLALSNRWAKLLGGELRLKPDHDSGACFQFIHPAC